MRTFAKYASPFLGMVERFYKTPDVTREQHPIYIIGAPRTGSTILYQALTSNDEVIYINNFINLFHRNLFAGFQLNKYFIKDKPHDSFSSDLGNTVKSGWNAPSESGNFWYNWVSKSNDYDIDNNLPVKKIIKLRQLLRKILNRYNKPLIFKNLHNSLRIPLISTIDPQSKIIWIKREYIYTAQSILLARRKSGIKPNDIWSVNPQGLKPELFKDEFELIVHQIYGIEKQIEKNLKSLPDENILIVKYETLQSDLWEIFEFSGITKDSTEFIKDQINLQNTQKLPDEEWTKLQKEIQSLTSPS